MTEKECLAYCYKNNIFWNEGNIRLYDILDRVSCWCCANKNMKELRNYKKYLPKYFEDLMTMTEGIWAKAKNDKLRESTEKFLKKLEKIKYEEE